MLVSNISNYKAALSVVSFAGMVALASASAVKETQNTLSEWISLEKQISEEKYEWTEQQEILKNSIEFMEAEIARLQEVKKTAEETASAGERKRSELEAKKSELDAASDAMKTAVDEYEARIKRMSKSWPKAFIDSVGTFLKRIPAEDQKEATQLTIRLQNIVTILSQFDKFQSAVTKDTGIQEVEGEPREVTTLYFGFAYAYFVDGRGEYAGYGYPTEDGWSWNADPSLAPQVNQLLSVFERSVDAVFVDLPAEIVTP